ncbi:hypothetical protein V6N11_004609 [Hibiscus sabdariffa]|uniref:CCHC-type domain-containing protein n=1 Tax=Hibiscus sabdariffa TaxID=183260 RepID=A0ABR2SGS4_9ROSI
MLSRVPDDATDDRSSNKPRIPIDKPPDAGGSATGILTATMDVYPLKTTCNQIPPFRDILVNQATASKSEEEIFDDEDIEILDDDVQRSIIDGLISIDFSARVQTLAEKSLDLTVVIKLLGHRIGYSTLKNRIYDLSKPSQAVKLMDIENDYYLVSFRTRPDFLKALAREPRTPDFTTSQPFPSKVVAWIRLPNLPVTFYKQSLISAIGESIGKVFRIDYRTESGCRGRFVRMEIEIDLQKPLTSKILINGQTQLIEYESLPLVCFSCGRYGHSSDSCRESTTSDPSAAAISYVAPSSANHAKPIHNDTSDLLRPWMFIKRRSRKSTLKQPE